jgi:hypothetical protein
VLRPGSLCGLINLFRRGDVAQNVAQAHALTVRMALLDQLDRILEGVDRLRGGLEGPHAGEAWALSVGELGAQLGE